MIYNIYMSVLIHIYILYICINNIYKFIFHFIFILHILTYHFQHTTFKLYITDPKKNNNLQIILCLSFYIFQNARFHDLMTDVSSLIVSLFEKQINRLFSCFLEVS